MSTYKYYQPDYVGKFQCNGQKCSARCCRKGWNIFVDKKLYKKYSHLKPKSSAKEIIHNLKKIDNTENYQVIPSENGSCRLLTDDNLCIIQKKHGEEYLPDICVTYPRKTWNFEDFYERSLSLTCPVVAEMVLLPTDPLKFEEIEVSEKVHNNLEKIVFSKTQLASELFPYIVPIQKTMTKILQERTLNLNKRLLILGLYCDKLDEMLHVGNLAQSQKISSIFSGSENQDQDQLIQAVDSDSIEELPKVNDPYKNSEFLRQQANQVSAIIKFDAQKQIKILIGVLTTLYLGEQQSDTDKKILQAIATTLKLPSEKYSQEYQKFLEKFSTVFENYLVHESFINLYPFKFNSRIVLNYSIFLIMYKVLELLTFSLSMQKFSTTGEHLTDTELISEITSYTNKLDENSNYFAKILEYFKGRENILEIMQAMLQVQEV